VILTPITRTQVTQVLALTHVLGATFSIRGGGHLQDPGFNSNDGGIVISFCKGEFTQLILSGDKKTVNIGVGLRWADVYERLDEHGLAAAGGREPRVGVAGFHINVMKLGWFVWGMVDYEVGA
jgi:FAD/FMN-containing dehydrogenase